MQFYDGTNQLRRYSLATIDDGTWHHIVTIFKNGEFCYVYIDGVRSDGATLVQTLGDMATPETVCVAKGTFSGGFLDGIVDEIRAYNRILTIDEIKDLYNHGIVDLYGSALEMEYGSKTESKVSRRRALEELCFVTGWEIYVSPTGIWDFRSQCGIDRSGTIRFNRGELLQKYVTPYSVQQKQKVEKVTVIGANQGSYMCYGNADVGYEFIYIEKDINRKNLVSSNVCGTAATSLLADFQNDVVTTEIEVVDTFEGHAYDVFDTVKLGDNILNIDESLRVHHIKKRFAPGLGEETVLSLTNIQHLLTSGGLLLQSGEAYLADSSRGVDDYARVSQMRPVIDDVTASRALDTVYQNTQGRPILCIVTVRCIGNANNDTAFADAMVGETSPPAVSQGRCGNTGGPARSNYHSISFTVPDNEYYEIESSVGGTGTISKTSWVEITL